MKAKKKIIVIGGGFAGIQLVKKLDEKLFDILLIDKLNHHQFQPLFYQVATAQIEPASISFPLRNIFKRKKSLQIRLAEVYSIDHSRNEIKTSIGSFDYDYLVIATGCTTNFFNNSNIEKNTFTLKTTYDAIRIRNHIIQTFEKLLSVNSPERESLLNLVIVGGGPTGIELAGAFAEIKNNILPKDYPGIDFSHFNIHLIEGSSNTLNNMSNLAKAASKSYLQEMGVIVMTDTIVKNYVDYKLELSNGTVVNTKTVIWAAGIIGNTINGLPANCIARANRIKVNRLNLVEGMTNIFAVGDIAMMETPKYPNGHPQIANVAIGQANKLAANLERILVNKGTSEYEYKDFGSMATIGRNKAVVDLPFIRFKGYFAWLTWMFLHLMFILSVRNKLIIFINWAWVYLFKDTSLRLILTPTNNRQADPVQLREARIL